MQKLLSADAVVIQVLDPQGLSLFSGRSTFFHFQRNIAAYHHVGKFLLGVIVDVAHCHCAASAQNGKAVAQLLDFIEFVGDKDDGMSHIPQLFQFHKEFGNLLGSQHGSRLV